jgi:protein TonB
METRLTTRALNIALNGDQFGGGFMGSFALHAAFIALLLSWAWIFHSGQNWGDASGSSGSIQATMVADIPLPPKLPMDPNNVLATDNPSPAPVTPAPKTVEVPQPNSIAIPTKSATKPVKTADKTTPAPPLHPQPGKIDPNKAQTGEAGGSNLTMSSTQTRAGTFNIGIDNAFGTKYAYYVQQITNKVAQQWYTNMLDPQAAGHRASITFQVERDGSLSHIQLEQRSGDATLDSTALNAVRHIDTFGSLPETYTGNHIIVHYYFDPPPRP